MKLIKFTLMLFYLSTLAYGIFLTDIFRLPAPMIFCTPLLLLWTGYTIPFCYSKQISYLCIAIFLYEVVGLSSFNRFFSTGLSILFCALYFSNFVQNSSRRYNWSVYIFYGLLLLSTIVMVANHYFPQVDQLRGLILGDAVLQSPAGISLTQFSYGYQLAAFVPFALLYTFTYKRSIVVKIVVFTLCSIFVFLGMQRSVFVCYASVTVVFLIIFYRFKAVLLLSLMVGICFFAYQFAEGEKMIAADNILTKNEHNDEASNRSDLANENLKIYAEYPYGLIFYGKDWGDVIYRNYVFSEGITSHNAYLMFFTYLGPFFGFGLLGVIFLPIARISFITLKKVHAPENRLLICLIFSFISVSINALSHNAWLFSGDGPTVFSFFCVLHGYKLKQITKPLTALPNSLEHVTV